MKFACPKCKTRYSIADEKVPPAKTLRFPCKKCGNVMRLRRRGAAAKKPTREQASNMREASTKVASVDEINRLRHAASDMGVGDEPEDYAASTRVADLSELRKMATQSVPPEHAAASAVAQAPADIEWFVLVGGKQEGPLSAQGVRGMLERNQIDKRTYVWRDGLGDWKRLGTVTDFTEAAAGAGDAAWRVMAPTADAPSNDDFGESTKAMDIGALRDALAKTRDAGNVQPAASAGGGIEEFDDGWDGGADSEERPTVAQAPMPAADVATIVAQNQDALVRDAFAVDDAPAALSRRDSFDIDEVDDNPFSDMPETHEAPLPSLDDYADPFVDAASDVDNAELISALSGEPTGDGMSRPMTEEMDSGILGGPEMFPDDPAAPPEFDARSGERMAAKIAHEITGLDDVAEEPIGDFGPGFDEGSNSDVLRDAGFSDDIPPSGEYFDAPPGESTRVFMATAGLYRRRRTHRLAAIVGVFVSLSLVAVVSLDILGMIEIPGMGVVYDMTGLIDPNTDRAMERVKDKLEKKDLTADERVKLEETRTKLLGNLDGGTKKGGTRKGHGGSKGVAVSTQGIDDKKTLNDTKRDMAKDIFSDDRKKEGKIGLDDPKEIQAPNLPEGLTQKTIYKVIMDNSKSVQLCLQESQRKGEKLGGKMQIELTINPNGTVPEVEIGPAKYHNTVMASCAVKRIRNWRFPAYNGEPVTVTYPYVLEMSF